MCGGVGGGMKGGAVCVGGGEVEDVWEGWGSVCVYVFFIIFISFCYF